VSDHTEIDHIKPHWDGGTDNIENLQVLCYRCHQQKSAEEFSQYSKLHPVIVVKDGVVISKQEG
jgi:5-methylcytosine-specific restriction endonuclease McrA